MNDRIERDLLVPVPRPDAWRAITDPALLGSWLADEVELDLTPGGEARFRFGAELRRGWVEDVSPPHRLAFWWEADGEPASRVEISLSELDERSTRVRVIETRPLELLDLVGIPLPGHGGASFGPALSSLAR